MTPPKKMDDDIEVHFSWKGLKKALPWILFVLSGGGLMGLSGGMMWGSPRSNANSQAITTMQLDQEKRAKEIQDLKQAMTRVETTTEHIKETVNEIKRDMRDYRRHASRPTSREE